MHSFPQFTRSTLWGEFAWVGAIIFEGNFLVRWQFSSGQLSGGGEGGQLSTGEIVQGAIIRGAIIQEAIIWGGAIFLGGQLS